MKSSKPFRRIWHAYCSLWVRRWYIFLPLHLMILIWIGDSVLDVLMKQDAFIGWPLVLLCCAVSMICMLYLLSARQVKAE